MSAKNALLGAITHIFRYKLCREVSESDEYFMTVICGQISLDSEICIFRDIPDLATHDTVHDIVGSG